MGCATSKRIKLETCNEAGMSLPSKTSLGSQRFNSDIENYHRHLLALTSASSEMGVATVNTLKAAETKWKNEDAAGHMDSLNGMYDKLGTLESAENAPQTWNEVRSMLEIMKSIPNNENSLQSQGGKDSPTGFCFPGNAEAIDVQDIMKGLEDETPRCSSASQNVDSLLTFPGSNLLTKFRPESQHIKKFDEANKPIHTVDELDARLGVVKDSDVGKVSEDKNATRKSQTMLGSGMVPPKAAVRQFSFPSHAAVSGRSTPDLSPGFINANVRDITEDNPLYKDISMYSGTEVTPTPDMKYSSTSRKEKPVSNVEPQNDTFTGTPTSVQTASSDSTLADELSEDSFITERGVYFDPELLNSYEKALEDHSEEDWNALQVNNAGLHQNFSSTDSEKELRTLIDDKRIVHVSSKMIQRESSKVPNLPSKTVKTSGGKPRDPFENFEQRCPPGGEETVVLYTTTLRGIRKTFEDCNKVREILQSFGLSIDQRDVSMHLEFRNELMELMGRVVSVPRLFIKGRYIGGREDVAKLHENAKLMELIEGLPKERTEGSCDGCGGMRFILCLECSGSCKIVKQDKVMRCADCNENGLIQCPICS